MVTKIAKNPLGMGIGSGLQAPWLAAVGVNQPKMWIGAAIGAVGGIASSLFGGAAASKAAKEAQRKQEQQENREAAWYARRYNEDYLDSAAGQNLVRRAKDYANETWKKAAGAQAVAGGTDAATAQAKEAGNRMMGDTIANIAASDQERKAQVDNMHRQAQAQFAQQDMQREMQRAQNITNAASAASNALMSIGSAVDQASVKPTDLNGGGNNSKVAEKPATQPSSQPSGGGAKIDSSVHESNLASSGTPQTSLSHTDDDLLKRMAGEVKSKIGV